MPVPKGRYQWSAQQEYWLNKWAVLIFIKPERQCSHTLKTYWTTIGRSWELNISEKLGRDLNPEFLILHLAALPLCYCTPHPSSNTNPYISRLLILFHIPYYMGTNLLIQQHCSQVGFEYNVLNIRVSSYNDIGDINLTNHLISIKN